jgi:hypothetical protein
MITIASAQKIAANARIMTVPGERSGQMALILKIALIVLAVVLGLSIFEAILIGLIYLAKFGIEKKAESEEKNDKVRGN